MERKVLQLDMFSKELAEVQEGDMRYVLSVNEELEESEKDFLHYQKAKVNNLLKPVESSWEERRKKNIENRDKILVGETKNKKQKTAFDEKDLDRYRKRVFKVIDKCRMTKYFTVSR